MQVQKKVLVVFGTRPEAVKMAPLVRALQGAEWCKPFVAVTAQHREMLDQVMRLFGLEADFDLNLLRLGQTLTDVTSRAIVGLTRIMEDLKPDAVVVQGDTTTTFAGALAAFYQKVPVVHLEAGLRTDDPYSPFPEEVNRRLTTQLATAHMAATSLSASNLLRDGINAESVYVTGNTVIDSLRWITSQKPSYNDPKLEAIDAGGRRILLVTAHRRESWGEGMGNIALALRELAESYPDVDVVFPIHKNPLVRDSVVPLIGMLPNVSIFEPLDYGSFSRLMARSTIVLTDSGGVQEEAPSLGKPVLVLRTTTERPEAVAAGTARLVGTDPNAIVSSVSNLLDNSSAYAAMANATNPYGDGFASSRTVAAMAHLFGLGPRPDDFVAAIPAAPN
jgi:UDP-N-acetylglucosamine 2-epimerase (non-hydrolysing)